MSSESVFGNEGSDVQEVEHSVDEDDFEVIDEVAERERNLRPTVEMEIRATVDTNAGIGIRGLTLAAEERLEARELEIERTRVRWDRRQESDREARCRKDVGRRSRHEREAFAKRAGSVDRWLDPAEADPREQLSREELATVNREAMRVAENLNGWTRAAISRRLAERVVDGADVPSAVIGLFEDLRTAPGETLPIETVREVPRREVDVTGEVAVLWEPSSPAIQQVGLLEDETGRIKFTIWRASNKPTVAEGERVRFRAAAKNWYQGRCSIAITGRSRVISLDSRTSL